MCRDSLSNTHNYTASENNRKEREKEEEYSVSLSPPVYMSVSQSCPMTMIVLASVGAKAEETHDAPRSEGESADETSLSAGTHRDCAVCTAPHIAPSLPPCTDACVSVFARDERGRG